MSLPLKKKPCKGNYRTNNFTGCQEFTIAFKYGLCKACFLEWCHSTGEGMDYIKKNLIPKAKKDVKAKSKAKTAKQREALKTLTQLENEAKTPFQKFIRLRDADENCASCGTNYSEVWDGGHFYKAEIYSGLIFNENNCHKQCKKCNRFLNGNENNYRLGLIERYGLDYVLKLDVLANETRQYKYTRQELIDLKKKYNKKVREITN